MTPERIFDGAHLRATLYPGQRDQMVVTFDYRKLGRDGFTPDNHSSSFARQGFAQLSIKSRQNDWFINPDTLALESVLAGLAGRYARVSLLGYSMGGYGALRFARVLGAASAVLISPQVSIARSVVPFEWRYKDEAKSFDPALGDLTHRAVQGMDGLIVLDPFVRLDLKHARMIQSLFPALSLVRLNFGGHPAIRVLRGAGNVWAIQREVTSPAPTRKFISQAHRAGRAGSAGYWTRLARHAETRRPELAAFARMRAASLEPRVGDAAEDAGGAR